MTIKIGDRVRYDEENVSFNGDIAGTVVEPTRDELAAAHPVDKSPYVRVAWDDGERFWEDPNVLVVAP